MRILVTGGAGFIGSAFVRRQAGAGDDSFVVLDLMTYAGNRANLAPVESDERISHRYRFVHGDIADRELVEGLVKDVDAIVNFAAETHVDRSIHDADAVVRTGVIGVHVLLETVRRAREGGRSVRFVQVSTDEVYGSVAEGARREEDPLAPRSPYAAAKAAGDLLCLAYHETYGLDVVISRGANTYGPYQHPEKLVPLFITNALVDEVLPLYGDGRQRRDWLHVDDHADAIALILQLGVTGQVYNVPAGEEMANREVVEALLNYLGKPWSLVRTVADRPGHDQRYAMDGSRIRQLGWRPRVSFDDGMGATVEWYRQNRPWWEQMRGPEWAAYYERQYGRRLAESSGA